jgi:hypothetical protein
MLEVDRVLVAAAAAVSAGRSVTRRPSQAEGESSSCAREPSAT